MPTSVLGTVSTYVGSTVSTEAHVFFYTSIGETQAARMSSDAEVAMPVTVMSANLGGSINITSTVLVSAYICSVAPVSLAGGSLNVTSTVLTSTYVQSCVSVQGSIYVSSLPSVNVTSTVLVSSYICSVAPVSVSIASLNITSTILTSTYVQSCVSVQGSVYVSSLPSVNVTSTVLTSTYVQSCVSVQGSVYVSSLPSVNVTSTVLTSTYVQSCVSVQGSVYISSLVGSVVVTDVEKTVSYYNSAIDTIGTSTLVSPGAAEKVQVKYIQVVSATDDVQVKIWEEDTNTHMCFFANMLDGSAINANLIGANWITTTINKDVQINLSKAASVWVVVGYILV